jgi:hypothetical protein
VAAADSSSSATPATAPNSTLTVKQDLSKIRSVDFSSDNIVCESAESTSLLSVEPESDDDYADSSFEDNSENSDDEEASPGKAKRSRNSDGEVVDRGAVDDNVTSEKALSEDEECQSQVWSKKSVACKSQRRKHEASRPVVSTGADSDEG